jgi:hypothetical protein
MNATQLRQSLYAVLDQVLETGEPVLIKRNGKTLKICVEPVQQTRKIRWPKANAALVNGDVDDILEIDWSKEWKP